MRIARLLAGLCLLASSAIQHPALAQAPKGATPATIQANDKLRNYLNFSDQQEL